MATTNLTGTGPIHPLYLSCYFTSLAPHSVPEEACNLCIGEFLQVNRRMVREEYIDRLLSSATVLCLPGLGYDTYRTFEALFAG